MAFNRPDHLSRLLGRLREVQPQRVFVAIDGARAHIDGEAALVDECRDLVASIDWTDQVMTLFQSNNLGCGNGVSTAISWFFDHVEQGIILEDDIIPEPDFFPYCAVLLNRYRDDDRVFAISGCNFVPPEAQTHPQLPYRFSQVPHIWGWATWKRSWEQHTLDIAGWHKALPPGALWRRAGRSVSGAAYWGSTFELLARKQVDTWDGQLVFASMVSGQLTATSNVNLIENIGFGESATHTREDRNELQPRGSVSFPLPQVPVEIDERADSWTRHHHFRASWRGIFRQAQTYLSHRGGQTT
jgi:hypothetical protein